MNVVFRRDVNWKLFDSLDLSNGGATTEIRYLDINENDLNIGSKVYVSHGTTSFRATILKSRIVNDIREYRVKFDGKKLKANRWFHHGDVRLIKSNLDNIQVENKLRSSPDKPLSMKMMVSDSPREILSKGLIIESQDNENFENATRPESCEHEDVKMLESNLETIGDENEIISCPDKIHL